MHRTDLPHLNYAFTKRTITRFNKINNKLFFYSWTRKMDKTLHSIYFINKSGKITEVQQTELKLTFIIHTPM